MKADSLVPEVGAIGCFLPLLWAGITFTLNHEYQGAKDAAVRTTSNLTQAFEESSRRTIGQINSILLSSRALRTAQGDRFNFADWARTQAFLDTMTAQIGMADATGLVFASTRPLPPGVSIADRPHFQAQVDPSHDDLFISRPVVARVSGQTSIQFSRKLLDQSGGFAGVTVFSIDCAELSRFYETLKLGHGFVSILSADGTWLAHGPSAPGLIGTTIKGNDQFHNVINDISGSIDIGAAGAGATERFDIAQISSFRRLRNYPVIVMVGLDG